MEDLQCEWLDSRLEIAQILVRAEFLSDDAACSQCSVNRASIQCYQCGISQIVCHQCDRNRHTTNPFHDREAWLENHFEPLQSCQGVDESGLVHETGRFIACGANFDQLLL
jgi:hypothetical protein